MPAWDIPSLIDNAACPVGQPRRAAIPSLVVYTMGVPAPTTASREVAAARTAKMAQDDSKSRVSIVK